jgi:gentisate 1,2-dioxygenase
MVADGGVSQARLDYNPSIIKTGEAMTTSAVAPDSALAKLSRDIQNLNARPLWERTQRMGPGTPAVPTIWRYRDLRPQLLRAIDLITAKEAERRVFMLENPGLPGTGYITTSLYCGLQVIKPGEIAPAHRHSPNALRFIIEGNGAYTTVEGERVSMGPGDFVLTPGWTWHDHGHLGDEPVIWLDALDNPFGQFFGAIFRENYPDDAQAPSLPDGDAAMRFGANLMPLAYRSGRHSSPILVYPYDRTREALLGLARSGPLHPSHGIKMRYANPLDGGYVYPTIAVFIQYLPAGFSGQSYRATDGTAFTVVEGHGTAHIGDQQFDFEPHDVFVVPAWVPYHLSTRDSCVLFSLSDRAAQEKLGFWREEDPSNSAMRG